MVSGGVCGGEGAVGGVEVGGVEPIDSCFNSSNESDAHPLKADSDISESGDSSFFCHLSCLGRQVQSDWVSIVAELFSSIGSGRGSPLASVSIAVSVS